MAHKSRFKEMNRKNEKKLPEKRKRNMPITAIKMLISACVGIAVLIMVAIGTYCMMDDSIRTIFLKKITKEVEVINEPFTTDSGIDSIYGQGNL